MIFDLKFSMDKYFARALALARRTGDRLIVYDSAKGEKPLVLMDMDAYESMLLDEGLLDDDYYGDDGELGWNEGEEDGLTGELDIDRINRDMPAFDDEPFSGPYQNSGDDEGSGQAGSRYADIGFDPGYDPDNAGKKRRRPNWAIPSDRKKAAEAVVEDEDTHYLEEVRF